MELPNIKSENIDHYNQVNGFQNIESTDQPKKNTCK